MQTELLAAEAEGEVAWPYEADFILSTLQTAPPAESHQWREERTSHRVAATFEMTTVTGLIKQVIFTRDLNAQSLGFITRTALPKGVRGMLWLPLADGTSRTMPCKVARCHPAAPGWLEGVLQFEPGEAL